MTELHFEGAGRSLVVRRVTVGGYKGTGYQDIKSKVTVWHPKLAGWRVIESGNYLFQFKSKAKAVAYAKGLTGAKRAAKAAVNGMELGLI